MHGESLDPLAAVLAVSMVIVVEVIISVICFTPPHAPSKFLNSLIVLQSSVVIESNAHPNVGSGFGGICCCRDQMGWRDTNR